MPGRIHKLDTERQRVRFGAGVRRDIAREIERLERRRALVLTTPGQSGHGLEIAEILGALAAGISSNAAMHTPVTVTGEVLDYCRSINADCLVSIGGGSTIGLGKAISHRTGLMHIAIPTTYAGSEATPILGQTENGIKTTLKDDRVLPGVILYDSELVATLPAAMTVTSALNAMAHAVEGLYARDRTEKTTQLALFGLETFAESLSAILDNPRDLAVRERTQKGAWACGAVLGQVGMALHHKLCHTLGGSFDLPHAHTHAVILPHATAYNEPATRRELAPVLSILDGETQGAALWEFSKRLGAPMSLAELGLGESALEKAADIATQNPYWNPREITREGLLALLTNAHRGHPPAH